VSKGTAELLLRLTTSSDTDLFKPSNALLSLAQLSSPCFAFPLRPSLYDPSLYEYHILRCLPYAEEEGEGSHPSVERVVTVHCGRGTLRYTQASCILGWWSVTGQSEEGDAGLVHKGSRAPWRGVHRIAICKTRSTCLVEALGGNVARQRRNGALEIAGSEDCTLPIDFEYGQGAPGTVLEFTEHAAICVRATNVRA